MEVPRDCPIKEVCNVERLETLLPKMNSQELLRFSGLIALQRMEFSFKIEGCNQGNPRVCRLLDSEQKLLEAIEVLHFVNDSLS